MKRNSLVGARLGKFDVLAEIGRGGSGMVYRGRDPDLDRNVAIKVLDPYLVEDEQIVKRFKREARLAARLSHPNIVTIYDVGQDNGWHYFVMEYLEGETLAEIIRQRAPLPLGEVLANLYPLALALDYAHGEQMVHRDVKPANVIIGPAGRVTLTDFGTVRAPHETQMTALGTIVGTPRYMSPEQVEGTEVGPASDRYSLGVVAYEMLSGRVPFQMDNPAAMLYKIAHEQTPPIGQVHPGIPKSVEAVLQKVLTKDQTERYPSAAAFVAALGQAIVAETADEKTLAALQAITPISTQLPARPDRPHPSWPLRDWLRRVPLWSWAVGGAAVLILLVLALVGALGGEPGATAADRPTVTPAATMIPAETPGAVHQILVPADGQVEMVSVPAGEFIMGTNNGNPYEAPVRTVYLDGFWIDKTEVTNAQFSAFASETGYRTEAEQQGGGYNYTNDGRLFVEGANWQRPQGPGSDIAGLDDYPVVLVSWSDAQAYCQWRNARLPTEAEWEKAARGDDARKHPWGDDFDRSSLNYCDANCPFDWRIVGANDGYAMTAPVGSYLQGASPYGALDMAGNLREWVADWFDENYYRVAPNENPAGPAEGRRRVARGSAWNDVEWTVRSTDRFAYQPTVASNEVGFRCAAGAP